ncbi:MAG TPA: HlyD family secretion protein [Candidatus Gastranaerophilaceae bacterium]|nr:HlyD family secretion protein [Candidatus Gastranaerophilaceae bacterium]HPT41930.1 HlyD family secretion protein [Candidatus Gastranaerophilaceae bacterium]
MSNEKNSKLMKKRFLIPSITIIVAILALIGMINSSRYQSTEDAYVETHTVAVAPKVSGQVIEMYVNDNQHVNAGDLVAKIDSADYGAKLDEISAKYEATLLKQKNAKAVYEAANSQITLAKKNLDRYTELYKSGAASKLEFDNAKTNYDNAQASLTQAHQNLLSKENNRVADADLKQLAATKKQAQLAYSYTNIYAPQSGFVSNKTIAKGAIVQAGQPLFTLVPDDIWIVANFKESQLENMKVGQEVEIKVDAYPHKRFKGKIDSIQRISGAKSSLFPPENAVGSFVKIVQRIPVKIVFAEKIDTSKYTIVPGMSVEPKVKVK